jgi:dienelactone hydrolase
MSKLLLILLTLVLITGCKKNSNRDHSASQLSQASTVGFDYRAPTEEDLRSVRDTWAARDLSAKDVRVVYEHTTERYQVKIYEHSVDRHKHYGAVVVPTDTSKTAFPVIVSPDGLQQENPSITLENNLGYYNSQYIMVVPAFRGRSLRYQTASFYAGGDFCDAYDGATDDSIALLNVVEANTPQADMQKVLVSGYSRGATVSLLMAERDKRVRVVVAGSGPVDFHRQEVANRYGDQYQCQFITGKTETQSRQRMLASSPLYFNTLPNVEKIHLFQGGADSIVPPWNAEAMNLFLLAQNIDVTYRLYPEWRHDNIWSNQAFVDAWDDAHVDYHN